MKKILLSAVALFATMTVNAQEVGQILTDDLVNRIGLTTDKNDEGKSIKNDVAAGTVFCESENVTMSAAFDDSYSPENAASPKIDDQNYGTIKIGDFTIDAKQAVQGNSNPKDVDGGNPATASTVPAGGAVFQFDVKKDGYLYVFHKATSNKNYMAYENKAAMGYVYTMSTDGTKALPKVFGYELKGEGEYNYLPEGTAVKTPEKYQLGDDAEEQKLNGLSVIKIPVFAGCSYWVNATGSKMTSCGYYFDTTGDATITIDNGVSGELVLLDKGQIPGAEPLPVYSVIGTLVGGWDVVNDVDMQLVNGLYSATIDNVAAGSYEWKIRQDHAWTINWGDNGDGTGVQDGPNFKAEMPEGGSITITFDPATAAINAYVVGGAIEPADAWKVEGAEGAMEYAGTWAGNWWNLTEDMNADVSGYDYLWIDYDGFEGEIQFGIFYSEWQKTESWGEVWYTDQIILTEAAGVFGLPIEKTKVIEKGVGGVDSEYKGDIYAKHGRQVFTQDRGKASKINIKGIYFGSEAQYNAAKEASAIQGVKTIKNDGAIYNVAGQKVSASYKGLVIKNGKKYIQK